MRCFKAKWSVSCRYYKMAKAMQALAATSDGKRAEGSVFNIDKAVMADFEPKTLQEILDAPVSTLQVRETSS